MNDFKVDNNMLNKVDNNKANVNNASFNEKHALFEQYVEAGKRNVDFQKASMKPITHNIQNSKVKLSTNKTINDFLPKKTLSQATQEIRRQYFPYPPREDLVDNIEDINDEMRYLRYQIRDLLSLLSRLKEYGISGGGVANQIGLFSNNSQTVINQDNSTNVTIADTVENYYNYNSGKIINKNH